MDWEDLKTFVAVAESGTVRRAAGVLGIHHATVARRVGSLETSVGARLFDRRPEGLSLTVPGEELLSVASEAGLAFEQVKRQIGGRDAAAAGTVTVSMGEPIASSVIVPALPDFAKRYPDLHIHIMATWEIADLARGDAEIAIRADNNPPDTLFGKRLFRYFETVYSCPAYLQAWRNRAANDPGRWIGWGGTGAARPAWVESSPYAGTKVWGGFASISLQVAAAQAGLGFAALPCLVGDSAPGLCRAQDAGLYPGRDIWLLTHPDLRRTRRIRIAMDFLEEQLRGYRALIEG